MYRTMAEMIVYVSFQWSKAMRCAAIFLMAVLWFGVAVADEDSAWPEELQLHGFLSQGFVKTSGNRFYGPSDDGSWDFREIGANLSYRPKPDLLFAGQLLSRTAGEMYDGSIRVDYALVDYAPIMRDDLRLGLRLGRLKNPLGLYNDTRDVPFTRPSIFLPQSIYFDKVRNLELSSDGGGLYGDLQTEWGDFFLQINVGKLDVDKNVEYAFLFNDWPGDLETDDPWYIGRLLYELDGGRLRLAASGATGKLNYHPGVNDFLAPGVIDINFWILSIQYNEEKWSLTAEYMNEPVARKGFSSQPIFGADGTAEGWYIQGTYRPHPGWELVLRYDESHIYKHDRDGEATEAVSGVPAHNFFAKDWTFGVRWDVTSNFMLRAEYHRIEGGSWLSLRENNLSDIEKDWDMFSILASYRF